MIRRPTIWLYISLATIIASIAIIVTLKPVWGIDFVGGSLIEIESDAAFTNDIRTILDEQLSLSSTVQHTQDGTVLIRTKPLDEGTHDEVISTLKESDVAVGEERRFESIGPTIGQELRKKSVIAIGLVVAVMVVYLAYTFRGVKNLVAPWKFGVAATYALVHDLILVTALFVIFGRIWGAPIDTLFVTAQLAILGYSVNDTIVLFNRMKNEWISKRNVSLLELYNKAAHATLSRSLNTSFTTLLVLVSLLVFGGSTIRWFVVALAAGTVTGTYSSLFVAPPLLHWLTDRNAKR